jgi:hypothetical protein
LIDFCGTGVSIEDMNEVEETAAVNGIRRLEVVIAPEVFFAIDTET